MAYETCEDCGSRVYNHGCTWCNEEAYIAEQERLTELEEHEPPYSPEAAGSV